MFMQCLVSCKDCGVFNYKVISFTDYLINIECINCGCSATMFFDHGGVREHLISSRKGGNTND